MIGQEAGRYAVNPNDNLASDWAPIFIGYNAGRDADGIENGVFIGTNAGNNSDGSKGSIFIGSNAGLDTTLSNSIGIGEHALRGEISTTERGDGNIEIVTGLLDNQRLMYNIGRLDNKLNIQNTIAGDTNLRRLSIGDAILYPDAPLSVRRDSTIAGHNLTPYIQSWHQDDTVKGYVNPSGNFVVKVETEQTGGADVSNKIVPAVFGHLEGICEAIAAPSAYADPTSGVMLVKIFNNFDGYETRSEEGTVWVINRDPTLTIHSNAYVITARVSEEHRPIYVSCPPS
jgi:hypothetical protein